MREQKRTQTKEGRRMTNKIKHWACENCNWNEDGIKHCRIREYNYAIYDLKCPREIELEKKAKK